jgi:uncharacterized membrane protein
MRRTTLLALSLSILGLPLLAGPASADFSICNKSSLAVRAAIGRFRHPLDQRRLVDHPAQACVPVLTGPLQGRFYYLYASDGAAGTWEGKTYFCIAPDKRFRSVGRSGCAKRGFDRRGFFEVDTGKKPNWTQSLSN